MEADLSEYFGRSGEFFIGVVGLILLLSMHQDVRRGAVTRLLATARCVLRAHASMSRNSAFYRDWSLTFQLLFRTRRDLWLIVLALTAFDYLSGWHAEFILGRFDLYPDFKDVADYDYLGQLRTTVFSAASVLGLLRILGYTLFCWLAFRIASGADYRSAATFRPYRRLAGLFLCVHGSEIISGVLTPYAIMHGLSSVGQISSPVQFMLIGGGCVAGAFFCLLGARLFNTRFNGRISTTTVSALAGYLLMIHLWQWLFYLLNLPAPSSTPWLVTLEWHVGNFTYTLVWNVLLVGFAIRLANPADMEEVQPDPSVSAVTSSRGGAFS